MTLGSASTYLAFQHNGKLLQLETTIISVSPLSGLSEVDQSLFKSASPSSEDYVVVTKETIFHPQGGGQPTDEGTMTTTTPTSSPTNTTFHVTSVRTSVENPGQVLHLGRFTGPAAFPPGAVVHQHVDGDKRLLYSRLHTAGHVLGAAVRRLLQDEIAGFDELKASHFPDSAACEFRGAIEGKWKAPIQDLLTEYVQHGFPVEIEFWSEEDFRRVGLERLVPDRSLLPPGEEKFRVVRIVGLETYPCGGTHVDTTDQCGETTVKKISRSKGMSRVSYTVQ